MFVAGDRVLLQGWACQNVLDSELLSQVVLHRAQAHWMQVSGQQKSVVLAVYTGPIDMRLAPWTLLRRHRRQLVPPKGYTHCWSM